MILSVVYLNEKSNHVKYIFFLCIGIIDYLLLEVMIWWEIKLFEENILCV